MVGTMDAQLFEVRDSVLGGRTTVVDASLGGRYVNLYAARFYEGPLSKPVPVLLRVRARLFVMAPPAVETRSFSAAARPRVDWLPPAKPRRCPGDG